MAPVAGCDAAEQLDQFGARAPAGVFGQARASIAVGFLDPDLDQLVVFEGLVERGQDGGRQPVAADPDQRVARMRFASQESFLAG